MLRLISRDVPRVATVNREGLIRRICMSKRLNSHSEAPQMSKKWPISQETKRAKGNFGRFNLTDGQDMPESWTCQGLFTDPGEAR